MTVTDVQVAGDIIVSHASLRERLRHSLFVRSLRNSRSGQIGAVTLLILLFLALFGPLLNPGSPTAFAGVPFAHPSSHHVLGLDTLGRDALSRFLAGGRVMLGVAFSATLLAYVVGVIFGTAAGYRRGLFDFGTVAIVDLFISFPPIVLVLALVAGVGSNIGVVIFAIAAVHCPRVVRLVRAVTLEVATSEYVEAAVARGERTFSILRHDIFKNVLVPISADFGIRLSGSVILFASLSYLGLGQQPPASDWGLMIGENQAALFLQPWLIVVPALAIALLSISVNLVSDALARSLGRSVTSRGV
jgi:peptide/nickel transport system permease protein